MQLVKQFEDGRFIGAKMVPDSVYVPPEEEQNIAGYGRTVENDVEEVDAEEAYLIIIRIANNYQVRTVFSDEEAITEAERLYNVYTESRRVYDDEDPFINIRVLCVAPDGMFEYIYDEDVI